MSSSSTSLFRPEVHAELKAQWLGPVLLAPQLSHRLFAAFALVATSAVLLLLFAGTYPRKARVSGVVVPEGGLAQVFARQPGLITDVFVTEGAQVKKGDRLVTISTEQESAALGATGAQVARQLTMRKESLIEERKNVERLAEQQKRSLMDRLAALEAAESKTKGEIGIQGARVMSAARTVTRQKAMMKESIASAEHVQSAEEGHLEQSARLQELERLRLATERDRLAVQGELDDLPLKLSRDLAAIDRNIAIVEADIAEQAARREIVLTAPETGVVTALQAMRGGHPDPKVPLLAIVPDGAKLEAHLLCPSRAVGFVKNGQHVLVRYEAFPYQKFGHQTGTVTSVSHSAVSPGELPTQAGALAREPVYRVTVALDAQTVRAFGKAVPLQPGMQLDADVVLEQRRLVEWMLEPLYTISGSWKQK
jgi:membrane fusion protein